jgi:hypothetical protein
MKNQLNRMWFLACLTIVGCSTVGLSSRGNRVIIVEAKDVTKCENLGSILGDGTGAYGTGFISRTSLIEHAFNDLRNKAAELGATHVVASVPRTTTVMGVAYRCR